MLLAMKFLMHKKGLIVPSFLVIRLDTTSDTRMGHENFSYKADGPQKFSFLSHWTIKSFDKISIFPPGQDTLYDQPLTVARDDDDQHKCYRP